MKQFAILKNIEALQDQTVSTSSGGGDYTPPAEGRARARLTGYIELGKHEGNFNQQVKVKDQVRLEFELSGKQWEPKVLDDGRVIPQKLALNLTLSTHEKAGYAALFKKMREGKPEVIHMAQLLGEAYVLDIHHETFTSKKDGKEVTVASIKKDGVYCIDQHVTRVPIFEDGEDTGEVELRPIAVSPVVGDVRCFVWNSCDKEQWDSLFIEPGDGDKSRNFLQDKIREAVNFSGSLAEQVAGTSPELSKQMEKPAEDAASAKAERVKKALKPTAPVSDDVGDLGDID